jgi:hypothetical protein
MKNTFTLSVAKPCAERWEQFTPTLQGGFCKSCNKNVTDFTSMSDAEILTFFRNSPAQSCGRFRPDQLRVYSAKATSAPGFSRHFLQAGFLGISLFLASKQAFPNIIPEKTAAHFVQPEENTPEYGSEKLRKIIKGTVKDEYKEPLPGVNIYLKGTTVGTITDANGNFAFPQELQAGDVLIFSFIGFETRQYVVTKDTASGIEIALVTLFADIMGEVAIESPYTAKASGLNKWWEKVKSLF